MAIGLRFHNHASHQLAIHLVPHKQAADQLGGNLLGGAGEERLGEMVNGYCSGLEGGQVRAIAPI